MCVRVRRSDGDTTQIRGHQLQVSLISYPLPAVLSTGSFPFRTKAPLLARGWRSGSHSRRMRWTLAKDCVGMPKDLGLAAWQVVWEGGLARAKSDNNNIVNVNAVRIRI